jgi:hypothetical protein
MNDRTSVNGRTPMKDYIPVNNGTPMNDRDGAEPCPYAGNGIVQLSELK